VNQRTLAIATLMLVSTAASARGWTVGTEAALGYDSNVANARQGGNERAAGFAELDGSLDRAWDVADDSAVQARFDLDTQAFPKYEKLDSAKGSLLLRYLLRPGQGFYAPTIALGGSAAWWEFNSRLRDSAEYRASAFVLEQITTRIAARLTGALDWRESRGEVFDLRTRSLGVDVDWTLTNRLAVYAGFQRRWGQFVTTRPAAASYAPGTVYADDDAFPGEDALRLDGAADITTGGLNFAFANWLSLDVQGTFVETGANTGLHYRRAQSVASLLARF
jgi:hypothetical protein